MLVPIFDLVSLRFSIFNSHRDFFSAKHSEKKFTDERKRKRTKENSRRFFFLILSNVKSATFENLDRQTTHRFGNCN